MVDMKGVDSAFLNSERRLANAVLNTCKEAQLTLLSYHCHTMVPQGVSCVGVLMKSHLSLHTWPEEGVITLDLFACGSDSHTPLVPVIERLFGIPPSPSDQKEVVEPPSIIWSERHRGFDDTVEPNDLKEFIFGDMLLEWKKQVRWCWRFSP